MCHDIGVILGDTMKAACAGHDGVTVFSMDPADGGSLEAPAFLYSQAVEGVTVGQALGYELEKIRGAAPALFVRAVQGDEAALTELEALIVPKAGANPRADIQRPSMAQDILKGRRTEIDAMNGYIARKGGEVGVPAPGHKQLAEIVTRIERGELAPSPSLLA